MMREEFTAGLLDPAGSSRERELAPDRHGELLPVCRRVPLDITEKRLVYFCL